MIMALIPEVRGIGISWLAWSFAPLIIVLACCVVAFDFVYRDDLHEPIYLVGVVVASRLPRNPIG
jgi:hypothetical protein